MNISVALQIYGSWVSKCLSDLGLVQRIYPNANQPSSKSLMAEASPHQHDMCMSCGQGLEAVNIVLHPRAFRVGFSVSSPD